MAIDHAGHRILRDIIAEVSKIVVGKDDIKKLLLVALLSQGHVLIEGLPGTAKTTISRSFAYAIGGKFKRIQGTPDMLPADILGFYLYRADGSSRFTPGPIFANVVLFDELNRTTPRTQAALLEAMQERQVTIERATYSLEQPFFVIADQIPYGGPGTSPLSEVQIDRFMLRLWSGLPSLKDEERVLKDIDMISEAHISPVANPNDIIRLQQEVKKVHVADNVRHYIISLLDGLRRYADVAFGPSPRAGIALFTGSRALAFIEGRDFVIPDDVKRLLVPAITHRLRITAEASMENVTPESIINKIAADTPVPRDGVVAKGGETAGAEVAAASFSEETEYSEEAAATINTPDPAHPEALASIPAAAPAETPVRDAAAPKKVRWARALPDWGWLLMIVALILAVVMVTVGLLALR